jgi:signal peptidase II
MSFRYKLFTIFSMVTILLDQATKWWARSSLKLHIPEPLIKGYWEWELSYNPGSAFGLFRNLGGARVWLSIIGLGACVAIFFILRKAKDHQKWMTAALGLVAGGALGNVIDRVFIGKVTDFVLWRWGEHRWPAFNIADAALVAGVLILFLDVGRDQKREKQREQAEKAAQGASAKKA